MNKGKSKKKMNSYLKMILLMAAGGVVGGIVGFVTAFSGEDYIAVIGHGMDAFLFAVRDHALMLECICGAICLVICETNYGKMKRMGKQMQDAGDDEYHELQYRIEVSSSWGMIASTVGTVLMMLIISPGYSMKYIESQSTGETWMFLAEIVVFLGLVGYFSLWQVRYVKLGQRLYPEKKGDPTSMKFQEQWLASCDEAEKEEIYEASYKTYLLTGKVLPVCTLVAMLLHMVWNTGVLAIIIPAFLWILSSSNYCHCCVTKKSEKLAK